MAWMVTSFVAMNNAHSKQKNLIGTCLLGNPILYNGADLFIDHPLLKQWKKEERLISICPKLAGGMPTLRAPAEIIDGDEKAVLSKDSRVFGSNGDNVTNTFIKGANKAFQIVGENNCIATVLTERSTSCVGSMIYDSSFSGMRK